MESLMSYVSRSDARAVACPDCGAEAGGKCVGPNSRVREAVHRGRMNAAAGEIGGYETRTLYTTGGTVRDQDGVEIGRLVNIEFDLQGPVWRREERGEGGGNLRRGLEGGEVGGGAVGVHSSQKENSPGEGVGEPMQTALLDDPVAEVWEHYALALDRPKAVLTPKVRRWISAAVQAVGVERCNRAIDGLAASEYHTTNGYVGIEYALNPKQGQTIESRVEMMEAKAPATDANGAMTVASLIARVPSEAQPMVRQWIADVEAMLRNPTHRGLSATGQSRLNDLRNKAHMEPIVSGDRITGWKDLRR